MALQRYVIYPILGTKTAVPADDPTLFTAFAAGFATNDVGGQHFDIRKVRNACSKSDGYIKVNDSAASTGNFTQGLFELYDGSNRDCIMFYGGVGYRMEDSEGVLVPTRITPSSLTFDTEEFNYSTMQYGSYLIFTDGETTPYKWAHSYIAKSTDADKLIATGTEYVFKYLEFFQGRIIGAYSNQTNGDIEVRWTGVLPSMSTLSFGGTSQAYKPGSDSIVAIKRLGANACYIYGQTSINRIDYYPDFTAPFVITELVQGQSCSNSASIISLPDRHYFFNRNYGFIEYAGGTDWRVISEDIEDQLDIRFEFAKRIVGTFDPVHKELVWCVPVASYSESTPGTILRYDIRSKQWRTSPWPMTCIDRWTVLTSGKTWNQLVDTDQHETWADVYGAGHARWIDLYAEYQRLVMSHEDGYVYYEGGTSKNTADFDGYRIEPILDMGDPNRKKHLLEIWMGFGKVGTYYIDLYWRGGDTAAECESHTWESIGTIRPCAATSAPVAYPSKNERFHQIKWGCNSKEEPFEVNRIDFYFHTQGKY